METAFWIVLIAFMLLASALGQVLRKSKRRLLRIRELEAACYFYQEQIGDPHR